MKFYLHLKSITISVMRRFFEDDCLNRAAALSFTTLLALVPLMIVCLSTLSAFPFSHQVHLMVQNFIFENFIPATGKIVQSHLQSFVAQSAHLPVWDVAFLCITVFLLIFTIEQALNVIWRAPQTRRHIHALFLYAIILCGAPALIAMSILISSYVFSLIVLHLPVASLVFKNILPFAYSFLGFTFLYIILPNCPVTFSNACVGGLFTAAFFEILKYAFAFYLVSVHDNYNQLLYGAFSTIPIFFIWVYSVWVLALLGAEISCVTNDFRRRSHKI